MLGGPIMFTPLFLGKFLCAKIVANTMFKVYLTRILTNN